MNELMWILNQLSGNGRWHVALDCMGGDLHMTVLIATLRMLMLSVLLWVAYFWRQCEVAASESQSKRTLSRTRQLFMSCAVTESGLGLLKIIWPCWWLWVVMALVIIYQGLRFIFETRQGFILIYRDLNQLQISQRHLREAVYLKEEVANLKEAFTNLKAKIDT